MPERFLPDNLRLEVWTKGYERKGPIRAVGDVTFTPRVHAASSLTFDVAERHLGSDGQPVLNRALPHLRAEGARVVVTYKVDGGTPVVRSGTLGEVSAEGASGSRVVTFSMLDDWQDVFVGTLGWPVPANTIGFQGTEKSKWSMTAPAETALLSLLSANRVRLGKPLTIPATAGRGATVTVACRMQPLADVLWPVTESVIAEVFQQNTARVLTIRTPATISRVFTEASGAVVGGSYLLKAPTMTRAVLGWGGEQQARSFGLFPTSISASPSSARTATEAAWGMVLEGFVDATDLEATAADFAAQRQAKADEALLEGAARSSVAAVLAETDRLKFGKTFKLGDVLKIQLVNGPVVAETLREVEITWTAEGLQVVPKVGLWEDSPSAALYRKVAATDRRLRLLGAR